MTSAEQGERTLVLACDDLEFAARCADAIRATGAYQSATLSLRDASRDPTATASGLFVVVLDTDPDGEPRRIVEDAEACLDAVVLPAATGRRVVLVQVVRSADAANPTRYWLRDRILGLARLGIERGEDAGVGVTLIRILDNAPVLDASWTGHLAETIRFVDSLSPALVLPVLELSH